MPFLMPSTSLTLLTVALSIAILMENIRNAALYSGLLQIVVLSTRALFDKGLHMVLAVIGGGNRTKMRQK